MSDQIDRRSFLARGAATGVGLAAIGASGGLLEACSSGSGTGSSTTNTGPRPDGVTSATPKRGGQLIFGTEAEEKGFDPTSATYDTTGIIYARTVFDPLAIIGDDGTVKPYLAESITPNTDYTVWTITLRPNLVFHDNTPCDGAALAYNLSAQKAALLTGPALATVSNIKQTGPLEVTVTMSSPWVPFDFFLAGGIGGQVAFIAAPSMLKKKSGTLHPVGTGPFVFEVWNQNSNFTATRNPHYWRKGLPYLDSVTYKPIPDSDQLLASLQSGSVDIMHTSTASVALQLRTMTSYAFIDDSKKVAGEPDMGCLLLNLSEKPFDDLKVRQAMAMACSSAQYVKVIDGGAFQTSTGPFVPGSPYYSPTGYPEYNPTKAKELIKEVEQSTGGPVSFALSHTPDPSASKIAQFFQQELQNAGMQVSLAQIQQANLIDDALTGKFQSVVWRQFGAVDPDLNYIFWSPTNINPVFSINMARNTDPRMQAALLKGRQAPAHADRVAAYQEVARLMGSDIPYVWSDRTIWSIAAHPSVQNFNNPTTPAGEKAFGMITGAVWPTQIWMDS